MQSLNKTAYFIDNDEKKWEVVEQGIKRKVMAYTDELMVVKVEFDKGSIGAIHQHVHTQITHIESGVFEVEIAGVKRILKAGDAFFIPSNEWHGVVCLEAGILIDVFTPMREDFILENKG